MSIENIQNTIKTIIYENKELETLGIPEIIVEPSRIIQITITYKNIQIGKFKEFIDNITSVYHKISKIYHRNYVIKLVCNNSDVLMGNDSIIIPSFICFDTCDINLSISQNIKEVNITTKNFKNCNFKDFMILLDSESEIERFNINLSNQKIELLFIYSLQINQQNDNTFKIKNCQINRIVFHNIKSNIGITLDTINTVFSDTQTQLSLKESTFNNRFILINSFFNTNFELNSVSFNDDTSFQGLKIKEINLDTTFFKSDKNVNFSELLIKDHERLTRSTSRKIKHLLERDSNKIESNYFHSYEMMARKKELNKEDVNDRIIFKLNEQVSNFGLNWNLPLFWMLFIGLYFSGLLYSSEYTKDSIILFSISATISVIALIMMKFNDLGRYFVALIPAIGFYLFMCHYPCFDSDNIVKFLSIIHFEKENTNISLTESSIAKLIMGYLIYHFVIAVRKDARK